MEINTGVGLALRPEMCDYVTSHTKEGYKLLRQWLVNPLHGADTGPEI
jgi:hypothetical protein